MSFVIVSMVILVSKKPINKIKNRLNGYLDVDFVMRDCEGTNMGKVYVFKKVSLCIL